MSHFIPYALVCVQQFCDIFILYIQYIYIYIFDTDIALLIY